MIELVDPTLSLSKDEELEVRRIINIALLCIQLEPERRPTMTAIVATLEGILNLEAEGMQHLSPVNSTPLEEQPPRNGGYIQMFTPETIGGTIGSSTTILEGR